MPALNKLPPRTRQARPSPRTSQLRSFIPHTPFVVPIWTPQTRVSHEKGRPYTPGPPVHQRLRLYRLQLSRSQVLPSSCSFPYSRKVAASLRRRPLGGEMKKVVVSRKDHQHHDNREPDAKPHLLGALRKRSAPGCFDAIEKEVAAIAQWDREWIEQNDRDE